MSRRRGESGLSGILLVDKPAGMTSHDVIDRVRRATGERRVGHAGTLDPAATGLLIVLVGPATRLASHLTAAEKTYEATIRFGSATDTDDAEGAVILELPVPDAIFDPAAAQTLLDGLLGESMQVPPAYSAIKVDGKVAHRAARGGDELELAARPIEVLEAALLAVDAEAIEWRVRFRVSKGTYIRSLARDLGVAAATAAHLTALRRTGSGHVDIAAAVTLDEIAAAGGQGRAQTLFADPASVFGHLVRITADQTTVLTGRPLPKPDTLDDKMAPVAVFTDDGRLIALYRGKDDRLVPEVVIATPVTKGVSG